MWTYGGTYPGLTIRRPTGQTTNVTFTNNLDPSAGALTVHNHGNHSTSGNDGQPEDFLIGTGKSRTYIYDGLEDGSNQRGKMQFYHDHRMDATARNVWMGLTGMYIVDDPADPATLPCGAFDLPLGQSVYLTDLLMGLSLLEFRVTHHLVDDSSIPPTLRPVPDIGAPTVTRNWSFDNTAGHWTIMA